MAVHNGPASSYSEQEALVKVVAFCAYQERSLQEVETKLYGLGQPPEAQARIMDYLVAEDYLNEERFATAYVRGKFRMKQWGRLKIRQGLQQKGVAATLIHQALEQLDPEEYAATLGEVLAKKAQTLAHETPVQRRQKLWRFASGRGFEAEPIRIWLDAQGL